VQAGVLTIYSQAGGDACLLRGLRRTPSEQTVQPLEVMILAGKLRQDLFEQKMGFQRSAALFRSWLQAGLVHPVDSEFKLTASGSWFAGEMMRALG